MPQVSFRQSRSGFTLIELLVVIAIIAILAAILFPVFAQAKAQAKKIASLSNVKQTGLAHFMYTNDYDDTLPTSWIKEFPGDFNFFVQPYMKNANILTNPLRSVSPAALATVCANDPWGSWAFQPGGKDNPSNLPLIWSYGFNTGPGYNDGLGLTHLVVNTATGGQSITINVFGTNVTSTIRTNVWAGNVTSTVVAPANVFLLGSTNGLPLMAIDIDDLRPAGFPGISDTPCEAAARVHGATAGVEIGGYCMTYVDGHSKWVHFNSTLTPSIQATLGGNDPVAVSDPCSFEAKYDGSSDTAEGCKENFPNGGI